MKYGKSQSILISGESGAGKTEASKYILQQITSLCKQDNSIREVNDRLLKSIPLLEAFGNAKTEKNNNSSRFGKYMEIVFDHAGTPIGGHITEYLLEKSRIIQQSDAERSFHIFYQLLTGADDTLLKSLKLSRDINDHYYLKGKSGTSLKRMNDKEEFTKTMDSLATLGIDETEVTFLLKCTAAVILIGNIEIVSENQDWSTNNEISEPTYNASAPNNSASTATPHLRSSIVLENNTELVVKNKDVLRDVAELLDLDAKMLEKSLLYKLITMGSNQITSPLKPDDVLHAKGSLAKAIYNSAFSWIVKRINDSISHIKKTNSSSSVSPVDINMDLPDASGSSVISSNNVDDETGSLTDDDGDSSISDSGKEDALISDKPPGIDIAPHKSKLTLPVIGILDIFGFEVVEKNKFEQFCINYCNERLHQLFIDLTIKGEQDEYLAEGITWNMVDYFNNLPICELIDERHKGIIYAIDDKCSTFGQCVDDELLIILDNKYADNEYYASSTNHETLSISVSQKSIDKFDQRSVSRATNPTTISTGTLATLRTQKSNFSIGSVGTQGTLDTVGTVGTARTGMTNMTGTTIATWDITDKPSKFRLPYKTFMISHYAGPVVYETEGFLEKSADLLHKNLKNLLASSKNIILSTMYTVSYDDVPFKRPVTSIMGFKNSLHDLIEELKSKTHFYIRCIKPNSSKKKGLFDSDLVAHQVKYLGLMEILRVRRAGFSYRNTHSSFYDRYKILLGSPNNRKALSADRTKELVVNNKPLEDNGNINTKDKLESGGYGNGEVKIEDVEESDQDEKAELAISDRYENVELVAGITLLLDKYLTKEQFNEEIRIGKTKLFVRDPSLISKLEHDFEEKSKSLLKVIQYAVRSFLLRCRYLKMLSSAKKIKGLIRVHNDKTKYRILRTNAAIVRNFFKGFSQANNCAISDKTDNNDIIPCISQEDNVIEGNPEEIGEITLHGRSFKELSFTDISVYQIFLESCIDYIKGYAEKNRNTLNSSSSTLCSNTESPFKISENSTITNVMDSKGWVKSPKKLLLANKIIYRVWRYELACNFLKLVPATMRQYWDEKLWLLQAFKDKKLSYASSVKRLFSENDLNINESNKKIYSLIYQPSSSTNLSNNGNHETIGYDGNKENNLVLFSGHGVKINRGDFKSKTVVVIITAKELLITDLKFGAVLAHYPWNKIERVLASTGDDGFISFMVERDTDNYRGNFLLYMGDKFYDFMSKLARFYADKQSLVLVSSDLMVDILSKKYKITFIKKEVTASTTGKKSKSAKSSKISAKHLQKMVKVVRHRKDNSLVVTY